ncbi:hypothetical protein NOS3756_02120 [Nostoc sp. NIES-3756]|uniref:hypothetical protein n=1 Tax=Nostoc sp. NIES-3756 TaxID=1751286 RepID=UPI0007225B66|nr:hypothetical protein [Nostoc sp. NIES-3756]BAT51289.1 hypothetical protein NOS3756_02120 [Nostoc sp. NIES-3756]
MDITKLKWTKNVTPLYPRREIEWAYNQERQTFKLHWRNKNKQDEKNAKNPEEGDIILLRQRGKVTHLVKLLDNDFSREPPDSISEFNIYRDVEVVWITDNWCNPPSIDKFFEPKIQFPRSGKVYRLENLKAYKQRWDKQGLSHFQQHVLKELKIC